MLDESRQIPYARRSGLSPGAAISLFLGSCYVSGSYHEQLSKKVINTDYNGLDDNINRTEIGRIAL